MQIKTIQNQLEGFFEPNGAPVKRPYLQGLRFLAILLVVISAFWQASGQPLMMLQIPLISNSLNLTPFFANAHLGVNGWLVLEGLILAYPFLAARQNNQPLPKKSEFYRQCWRQTAPLYYGSLFLMLLFYTSTTISPQAVISRPGLLRLVAHLTFTQQFWPVSFAGWGLNPALGTLTSLMLFVLLLPWLVQLFYGRRWPLGLALAIGVYLGWAGLAQLLPTGQLLHWSPDFLTESSVQEWFNGQFPAYLADFGFSLTLANLLARSQTDQWWNNQRSGWFYLATGLITLVYSLGNFGETAIGSASYYLASVTTAVGFSLIIAGVNLAGNWPRYLLAWSPWRWLGVLALPIYLWYQPLLYNISRLDLLQAVPSEQRFVQMLPYALVIVLIALLLFGTLQRPFLKDRKPTSKISAEEGAAVTVESRNKLGQRYRRFEAKVLKIFLVNPSSGQNLAYLDGIRSIAVILVIFVHTWWLSGQPQPMSVKFKLPFAKINFDFAPFLASGYFGVNLFFILSGLLLAQSWLKADFLNQPAPSLAKYVRQRIMRIVPAYYVCLTLMLVLMSPFFFPASTVYSSEGMLRIGVHMLFLQHMFPFSAGSWQINGSLWSLTMEMIFYAVLPWLVCLFLGRRWWLGLILCLGSTLLWSYLSWHGLQPLVDFWATPNRGEMAARQVVVQQFPSHLFCFGLGIVLANFMVRTQLNLRKSRAETWLTSRPASWIYFWSGWGLIFYMIYNPPDINNIEITNLTNELFVSLGFALVLAGLIWGGPKLRWVFNLLPLRFIGIIGYSVFLWHMPVIFILLKNPAIAALPAFIRWEIILPADLIITLALASSFYLLIEKPFILRSKKPGVKNNTTLTLSAQRDSTLITPLEVGRLDQNVSLR